MFNSDQEQVLLGTLLGNGKLHLAEDGAYLTIRSNSEVWLISKINELQPLKGTISKSRGNYYWNSEPCDELNPICDFIYPSDKMVVSMQWLDRLRAIGLAVWYGDSGCLVGRSKQNACLRTQRLADDIQTIHQYFNEVQLASTISYVRGKPVIIFNLPATRLLMEIVAQFLTPAKQHLIPNATR